MSVGEEEKKKFKKMEKNLQNKSKHKNNQCFLFVCLFLFCFVFQSLLSDSFPSLGITVHLTSLGCPPTLCLSLTRCVGSSDSNLALHLCVLVSNFHIY